MSWLSRDYLKVELAFGADLSATPDEWSWTDVSARMRESGSPQVGLSRGRADEQSHTSPSNLTLALDNDDGAFTPGNATSPHYPLVRRGVPIRVSVVGESTPLFLGQVVQWAPRWPVGDGQDYSRVSITAGGLLRQRSQRTKRAESSMATLIPSQADTGLLRAYWPCEDGSVASQFAPGLSGLSPLSISGDVEPAAAAPLAATSPLPRLNDGSFSGPAPGGVAVVALVDVPGGGLDDGGVVFRVGMSGGGLAYSELRYRSNDNGQLQITVVDDDGNSETGPSSEANITSGLNGGLWAILVDVIDFMGSAISRGRVTPIAADGQLGVPISISGTGFTGMTAGSISRVTVGGGLGGSVIGHVCVTDSTDVSFPYDEEGLTTAFAGESAVVRFARLTEQAGIPSVVVGDPSLSSLMGPQEPGLVLDLLRECVQIDGGIMSELRTELGLGYRSRHTLYSQDPALVLDAGPPNGQIVNPFEPVEDDQQVVNDVTVSRDGGSSARVFDQASIDAEGRYDEQISLNAHTDSQLPGLASWRLHLGTWPGMRYPQLSPALSIDPDLIPDWLALEAGDRVRIVNLPSQHPAGSVDLLVQGTSDTLTPTGWDASANMSPEGPYHIATVGGGDEYGRIGSDGCQTVAGLLLDGTAGNYASTPDAASLDITGDLDLRVLATVDWSSTADQALVAKFDTASDERSFMLWVAGSVSPGLLRLTWSEDGAGSATASSTESLTSGATELAIRAVLNADFSGSVWRVSFFTGPTLAGPWTALGADVDGMVTTSIHAGTAALTVGAHDNDGSQRPASGTVHAAEVRDGIGGTLVADPDFAAQTTGATSFSDDAGLTWTVNGSAEIHGEFISGTDTELVVASRAAPWINSTDHASDFPFQIRAGGVVLEVTAVDVNAQIQIMTVTQAPVNGVTKTIPGGSAVQVAHPVYLGL